jgi:hypothetical protein
MVERCQVRNHGRMHLDLREDENQGPTRVVAWAGGAQTDLDVLVIASISSSVLLASVASATQLDGIARVIAIVISAALTWLFS